MAQLWSVGILQEFFRRLQNRKNCKKQNGKELQEEAVQCGIQIKGQILGEKEEDQKKNGGLQRDQNKGEKVLF